MTSDTFHSYMLHYEEGNHLLLTARRCRKGKRNPFVVSVDANDLTERSGGPCAATADAAAPLSATKLWRYSAASATPAAAASSTSLHPSSIISFPRRNPAVASPASVRTQRAHGSPSLTRW